MRDLFLLAALAGFLLSNGLAFAQGCFFTTGQPYAICGTNGATLSQVYTPGGVIILSSTYALPDDLPNDILPEDVQVIARGPVLSFSGSQILREVQSGDTLYSVFSSYREENNYGTSPENSAVKFGGFVGRRVTGSDVTWTVAFDASVDFEKYRSRQIPLIFDRGPYEIPGADNMRVDAGLNLGAEIPLGSQNSAFFAGRLGYISLTTSRDLIEYRSFTAPMMGQRKIRTRGRTYGYSIGGDLGFKTERRIRDNLFLGLTGSLSAVHEYIQGFTEKVSVFSPGFGSTVGGPAGPLPVGTPTFSFGDYNKTSVQSRIGAAISRPFRSNGRAAVGTLSAAWHHEFADNSRTIDVFAPTAITGTSSGDSSLTINTPAPDRDFFTVGAGLASEFASGSGLWSINYEATLGHKYLTEHTVSLGIGIQF